MKYTFEQDTSLEGKVNNPFLKELIVMMQYEIGGPPRLRQVTPGLVWHSVTARTNRIGSNVMRKG